MRAQSEQMGALKNAGRKGQTVIYRRILLAIALIAGLSGSACQGQDAEDRSSPPAAEEPAPPGQGTEPTAMTAEELTRERCSQCHPYDRVEQARKDRDGWEQTVNRMIEQNGADISGDERDVIIDYLADRDS
jgi:hypothetical protein